MSLQEIIKLTANNQMFMIEKEILIEKSKYFAELLRGPFAKPLETDEPLIIDQKDSNTLKDLLFFVREGLIPDDVADDPVRLNQLKKMASFYMGQAEMKTPSVQIHTYQSIESFSERVGGEILDYVREFKSKYNPNLKQYLPNGTFFGLKSHNKSQLFTPRAMMTISSLDHLEKSSDVCNMWLASRHGDSSVVYQVIVVSSYRSMEYMQEHDENFPKLFRELSI